MDEVKIVLWFMIRRAKAQACGSGKCWFILLAQSTSKQQSVKWSTLIRKLEDYTLCAQKRKIEFDYTPLRMNGWSQNCFMIYDPTSESAGVWQRQVLVFPPRSVNKQTTTCEMKYVHWSDLDDDVGKKSNTSSILKFFMVVGTHLCKMATLLCHPTLSRPLNVSRQIGGNHEIPPSSF